MAGEAVPPEAVLPERSALPSAGIDAVGADEDAGAVLVAGTDLIPSWDMVVEFCMPGTKSAIGCAAATPAEVAGGDTQDVGMKYCRKDAEAGGAEAEAGGADAEAFSVGAECFWPSGAMAFPDETTLVVPPAKGGASHLTGAAGANGCGGRGSPPPASE